MNHLSQAKDAWKAYALALKKWYEMRGTLSMPLKDIDNQAEKVVQCREILQIMGEL